MDFLTKYFSLLCGQATDRSWVFGGEIFPLCQRCTGIYAGAAIAMLVFCCTRSRPHRATLLIHTLLILQIIPAGLHWWFDTPVLRTLSGAWFGIGLIGLLSGHPAVHWFGNRSRPDWTAALSSFLLVTLITPLISSCYAGTAILVVLGLLTIVVLISLNVWQVFSHARVDEMVGRFPIK